MYSVIAINKVVCVGRRIFYPHKPAIQISEEEYEQNKANFEFYKDKGSLRISSGKGSASRAEVIKEVITRTKPLPPKSRAFTVAPLSEDVICEVVKSDGERCKSKKLDGERICVFHKKMIDGGKRLKYFNE